jgi:hypothetical protein
MCLKVELTERGRPAAHSSELIQNTLSVNYDSSRHLFASLEAMFPSCVPGLTMRSGASYKAATFDVTGHQSRLERGSPDQGPEVLSIWIDYKLSYF